ncbi:NAD(P)-dependent oxidoreductase [Nocardia cyriacigeorgica]|uniref:NAD(P)-dependent oxidoreductase n=1 Tax=Nocardia cyriacigeorgica TaxID=135487 RepID=UPI002811EF9B|nr:NAD(P)-binding domain-containing protein [Nocardia cyriacigeorgica]
MSRHSATRSVTVIGLGPMGQAIARAYLDDGVAVTVWNRTAAKTDAMVDLGAIRADSVADALAASEVIVLSLTHYEAMYDVLTPVADQLNGKVVVNLSSDSPENTRRAAAWVRSRCGRFLAGGVMAQPAELAGPTAYVFYSGPEEVFDKHRDLLRPLGVPEYLGSDDGLAQLYYQAMFALFTPLLLGYEQAMAIIERSGSEISRFLPYAQRSLGSVAELYAAWSGRAEAGDWGDLAHLRMMDAGARHVVETGAAAGVDTTLAETVSAYWRRAIAESVEAGTPIPTFRLFRGHTV